MTFDEEEFALARILDSKKPKVWSDNLRPVSWLPTDNKVKPNYDFDAMVERGVYAAMNYRANHPTTESRNSRDLVVSILKAALGENGSWLAKEPPP